MDRGEWKLSRSFWGGFTLTLTVILVVVTGVWLVSRRGAPNALDSRSLPPGIFLVAAAAPHADNWGLRPLSRQRLVSRWAAQACGGVDFARALEESAGRGYGVALGFDLSQLARPTEIAPLLRCGRAVADSLGDRRFTELSWRDGTAINRAVAIPLDTEHTPTWAPTYEGTYEGITLRCSARSCPETAWGGFLSDATWYAGRVAHLQSLLRAIQAQPKNPDIEQLLQVVGTTNSLWLERQPAGIDLSFACTIPAPHDKQVEFIRGCYRPRDGDGRENLAVKLRSYAVGWDAPAVDHRVRFEFVLFAKDDAAAIVVQAAVQQIFSEMIGTVNLNELELSKIIRDGRHPAPAAVFDAWLRALRSARVRRKGPVVAITLRADLSEDEQNFLQEAASQTKDAPQVERVIAALSEARDPAHADLVQLLGEETAAWLTSPMATGDDCRAIIAHAEQLTAAPDAPVKSFGKKFILAKRYSENCAKQLLPVPLKDCLLLATSIDAMAECKAPVHPDVAAAQRYLHGNWQAVSAESRTEALLKLAVAGVPATRLEVSDHFADFTIDGIGLSGPLEILSASETSAVLRLTVKGRPADNCIRGYYNGAYRDLKCTPRRGIADGPHDYSVEFAAMDVMRLRRADEDVGTIFHRRGKGDGSVKNAVKAFAPAPEPAPAPAPNVSNPSYETTGSTF